MILGLLLWDLAKPSAPQVATPNCKPVHPISHPKISYGYGKTPDPFNPGKERWHWGIDFEGAIGTPIRSPVCGTVIFAGKQNSPNHYDWGYGWYVKIKDSKNRLHLFAHVSKIYVKQGAAVLPGQLIAEIGNNGNSTGPHVHYEVRLGDTVESTIDPLNFLINTKSNPALPSYNH